jgi:hypothetical protein
MKRRHLLLGAGLGLSAWLALFADKGPSGMLTETVAEAVVRPGAPAPGKRVQSRRTPQNEHTREKTVDLLLDREQLMGGARSGSGEAQLFGSKSWAPPPPPPPTPQAPPPPMAPPLPYQFLGKKLEDNVWEIYLGRDDQTFIVHEHGIIEDDYRVESIRPPNMTLTYLPLKQTQTLPIGESQ